MNPRKITLEYLGWCPGVESAASFKPDNKVDLRVVLFSNKHILVMGLFLILISNVGSAEIADEIITIQPGEYVDYVIDLYPGQKIRVDAGVYTD